MTPENFLLQLGNAQDRWKETAGELKLGVQSLTVEVRKLSDTMIALQTQDVAGQLTELRKVEIVGLKKRVEDLEDELTKTRAAQANNAKWMKVLVGVLVLIFPVFAAWMKWTN